MRARRASALAAVAALGLALAPRAAEAEGEPECEAWEVDYVTTGRLSIRDTTMGAGDGDHVVGPGTLTLRFEGAAGPGPGPARMLAYRMPEKIVVEAKAVFFSTKVVSETLGQAGPVACGVAAGTWSGNRLAWSTPMRGYRSDGTITCEGSMCGKMGAPPKGRSEYHEGPRDLPLAPFVFAADRRSFTMGPVVVAKTESPKQTTSMQLAGRETKRTCVSTKPCRP